MVDRYIDAETGLLVRGFNPRARREVFREDVLPPRDRFWRENAIQLWRRRRWAIVVIALYLLIALLDAVADLLQAEGIASVVDARTEAARRSALHHMDGGVSLQIGMMRSAVLELEALLAYDIDFPEEDDGPVPRERIDRALFAGVLRTCQPAHSP